jgi:hypothetical protein
MTDHLIIDFSRNPHRIRCLHCGFAQDLQLPMAISELVAMERRMSAEHGSCKPSPPPGPPISGSESSLSEFGPNDMPLG